MPDVGELADLSHIAFASADDLLVVEDAGDTLHTQRKALDSGYLYNVRHANAAGKTPIRSLAEGRDASATIDSLRWEPRPETTVTTK